MKFTLVPATESDRTYLRRLDYLADVFGDESRSRIGAVQSAEEYVGKWSPERDGGFIAYDPELVPAGGVWLRYWAPEDDYTDRPPRRAGQRPRPARLRVLRLHLVRPPPGSHDEAALGVPSALWPGRRTPGNATGIH